MKRNPHISNTRLSAIFIIVNVVLAVIVWLTSNNPTNPASLAFLAAGVFGAALNGIQSLAGGPFKGTGVGNFLDHILSVFTSLETLIRTLLPIAEEIARNQRNSPGLAEAATVAETVFRGVDEGPKIIEAASSNPEIQTVEAALTPFIVAITEPTPAAAVEATPVPVPVPVPVVVEVAPTPYIYSQDDINAAVSRAVSLALQELTPSIVAGRV